MKAFRMGRNTTEHYSSFEEAAKAWGCKPFSRKTKDEKKLAKQQEDFCAKYKCSACGQPMKYIGGRWMACANEKCKGIKVEREDFEGNKIVSYRTSCEYIKRDNDAEYASGIFS